MTTTKTCLNEYTWSNSEFSKQLQKVSDENICAHIFKKNVKSFNAACGRFESMKINKDLIFSLGYFPSLMSKLKKQK